MHLWLASLTQTMEADTAKTLILEINKLSEKDDCEYADSVLQVAMKENNHMFFKLKEASAMCEELAKLMEPEMREAKRIAQEEGRKAGMEEGRKAGMEEGRREGEADGINLSITVINKLRDGKSIKEIAKETGAEVNVIEAIRKSLGLD